MLIAIVRRLNEKRDETTFHLINNINDRVSEWTTYIDTAFSLEVYPVGSAGNIFVSEIV